MCGNSINRRELIGLGLGAAALMAMPRSLEALLAQPLSQPAPSDLDVALQAARWIRQSRIETATGLSWPADPLNPKSVHWDLYNGFPGVILFHLELYHATSD